MSIVNRLLGTAKQAASRGGAAGTTRGSRGTTGAPRRSGTGRAPAAGGSGSGVVGKVLRGLRSR